MRQESNYYLVDEVKPDVCSVIQPQSVLSYRNIGVSEIFSAWSH
jgi:hypothetical protein